MLGIWTWTRRAVCPWLGLVGDVSLGPVVTVSVKGDVGGCGVVARRTISAVDVVYGRCGSNFGRSGIRLLNRVINYVIFRLSFGFPGPPFRTPTPTSSQGTPVATISTRKPHEGVTRRAATIVKNLGPRWTSPSNSNRWLGPSMNDYTM